MSPAPIPTAVPNSFFGFQFHQVAMFFPGGDFYDAKEHWSKLGYGNWIIDHAELKGLLNGEPTITRATMAFNYDIMPMEYELLEYRGPSRHEHKARLALAGVGSNTPFISHMSVYTDDVVQDTMVLMEHLGRPPFHRFITQNHSNEAVAGKKRFIESIFDTQALLGFDTKLIQKVPHDFEDASWLDLQL